jgi:DNA-binding transcriptional regulator YiaG
MATESSSSPSSTLATLIASHDELLAEFERIRTENAGSTAIELPFEPGYRPGPLENWLTRLSEVMDKLRRHFRQQDRHEELKHYPIALYGEAFNFGHGARRVWLIEGLEEQRRLLSYELERAETATAVEDYAAIRVRWKADGWKYTLKARRERNGHTQKEAAAACGTGVETYRKWEEGRTPHSRNLPAALSYIRS